MLQELRHGNTFQIYREYSIGIHKIDDLKSWKTKRMEKIGSWNSPQGIWYMQEMCCEHFGKTLVVLQQNLPVLYMLYQLLTLLDNPSWILQ